MKISEVTLDKVKNHCHVYIDDDDNYLKDIVLPAAKSFIKNYTGLTDETVDTKEDLTIALLVLCSDMYDNRHFVINASNINPIAKSILGMHSVNLL